MKKTLSILLALIMMLSLAACGNDSETVETDLSKPITLNWIMPGPGIQTDAEMVWEKFNEEIKKVKGFENVTVHIEVIPMADYAQKIMLMQTSVFAKTGRGTKYDPYIVTDYLEIFACVKEN